MWGASLPQGITWLRCSSLPCGLSSGGIFSGTIFLTTPSTVGSTASATYTPHPSCYHIPFIPFMALTDHLRVPLCVILYCLPVCLLVCYHILFICLPVSYYVLFIYTLLCVIMHYVCQCLPVYYDYCLCTHSSVCDYTLFMYMFACILLCTIYVLAYL